MAIRIIADDDPGKPGIKYRYYVSVIDDDTGRKGVLAGPYGSRAEAESHKHEAIERARDADDRAHWYGYGICRAPVGVLIRPVFGLL